MLSKTLKPGLLVSVKSSVRGNVSYRKVDLEREHDVDGAAVAKWETERTIKDKDEHDRATKARSSAAYCIARVCASTSFGLLCPEDRVSDLDGAITEARGIIDTFNDSAAVTRISFYVIAGRVARDDVEAARAVRAEVSELIEQMQQGVKGLNADAIRDAAKKAKQIGAMLPDEAQARVESAIELARANANAIAKAIRAGEVAADAVDAQAIARLEQARTSFIDLGGPSEVVAVDIVPRMVELAPAVVEILAPAVVVPTVEFAQE